MSAPPHLAATVGAPRAASPGAREMDKLIYLDNAATTFPKPDVMHEKMSSFYRECGVNPGRTGCDLALKAEELIHDTRRNLSALFNPSLAATGRHKDPNRLVFAENATHGLNLIIQGTIEPGDHVVTTMCEHNSVIRPVNHMVQRGATATFVRPDAEGYVDPEEIRKAIRKETKLVVVNHGSNVIGTVQDIAAIGKVCAEEGVRFAVDGSQTAGVLPIDMAAWNISYLAFTGHKGLLGPTGMGGACIADDAPIKSSVWGGTGVRSAEPLHLEEFPYRLEAGTHNLLGIAGLHAGLEWILERGMDKIHQHEIALLGRLQEGVAGIKGVTIHGTKRLDRRVAVLSITVNGYDPSDVGTILDVEYGVLTRTGLQCAPLIHEHIGTAPRGTVRLSPGAFNTPEQIDHTIKAIAEIAADRN